MKARKKVIASLMLCLMLLSALTLPAYAAGTNLVTNPGFESGMTGWTAQAGSSGMIQTVNSDVHGGQKALYVGGFGTDGSTYAVTQNVSMAQPGIYEFTAYVKYKGAGTATSVTTSLGTLSSRLTAVKDSWEPVKFTVTVKQSTTQTIRFLINGSGYFLVDDVSLVRTGDIPGLISNEGFESGLTNWNVRGSANALSTDAEKHAGTKSVYLGYFANEALVNYIDQDYTPANAADAVGSFTFSAYIKTVPGLKGIGAALFIDAKDVNGRVLSTATSTAVSDSGGQWQKVTVSITAPQSTRTLTVKIGGVYCVGAFYVDDAKLERA